MSKISNTTSQQQQYLLKLIIIGDCSVGKTNILFRFCDNSFKTTYVATIGVDFKIKSINVGNKKLKLQIWDTAGQQRYKTIVQTYYRGVAAIILAYSITDHNTFKNIEKWMLQINEHAPSDVRKILVANKSDLEEERQVQQLEGISLSHKYNIPFMEVSAKNGNNIKQAFELLGEDLVRQYIPKLKNRFMKYTPLYETITSKDFNDKNNSVCRC